jgi:hypothetical protein
MANRETANELYERLNHAQMNDEALKHELLDFLKACDKSTEGSSKISRERDFKATLKKFYDNLKIDIHINQKFEIFDGRSQIGDLKLRIRALEKRRQQLSFNFLHLILHMGEALSVFKKDCKKQKLSFKKELANFGLAYSTSLHYISYFKATTMFPKLASVLINFSELKSGLSELVKFMETLPAEDTLEYCSKRFWKQSPRYKISPHGDFLADDVMASFGTNESDEDDAPSDNESTSAQSFNEEDMVLFPVTELAPSEDWLGIEGDTMSQV